MARHGFHHAEIAGELTARRVVFDHHHDPVGQESPVQHGEHGAGHIVSAALGLLGLLIAFTFAMAADRYEARRHLVMEEANAIASASLASEAPAA